MTRLSLFTASACLLLAAGTRVGEASTTVPAPASVSAERAATVASGPDAPAADELQFIHLVNQERRARGIAPLVYNVGLRDVARSHSREMAAKRYFAHESPTPGRRTPMDRYRRSLPRQPQYLLVGENLFYSSATGVERGHKALMDSEGHRRNLLDPRYDAVGVGTYVNADGEYWVTQMFLKRRD